MDMSRRAKVYDLAIDRARGRARREIVAMIGGLLILFNILAAGAFGAPAHPASPLLGDLASDRIVICTGEGMIIVDHSGKPVDGKSGSSGKALCPFCLPLMQGLAKTPDPADAAPAPVSQSVVLTRFHLVERPATAVFACAARPRAPPIL